MTKYQKCPTCGSDVEVQGVVTKSFVPLERIDEGAISFWLKENIFNYINYSWMPPNEDSDLNELAKAITQRFGKERIRVPEEASTRFTGHQSYCAGFNAAIAEFKRLNGID